MCCGMSSDSFIRRKVLTSGEFSLNVPFCINVATLDQNAVRALLADIISGLGAKLFRDEAAFFEVYEDRVKNAQLDDALDGPYMTVFIRPNLELGVSTADIITDGSTLYSLEQLQHFFVTKAA